MITRPLENTDMFCDPSLPKLASLKRTIQRTRRQHQPLLPQTTMDIDLDDTWSKTASGEPWATSTTLDNQKILMFATDQNLRYLSSATTWYGDGTFSIVPSLYYQLYTLHAPVFGKIMPLVYFLLPRKTQVMYTHMFTTLLRTLEDKLLEVNVAKYRCDYEEACIAAATDILNVEAEGCFFHLCQANYRHLVTLGFKQRYSTDEEFALNCRMISAMAYVPAADVDRVFEELKGHLPDELLDMLGYF
ncbi:uncharacterized protein LOC143038704 [Oratosquilla oratoria]|uniref:uncharacterized protein LOC143038704 n=1 Tax=Oratosquilla oratoria TaxID=337810 RepID=UPI003F76A88D